MVKRNTGIAQGSFAMGPNRIRYSCVAGCWEFSQDSGDTWKALEGLRDDAYEMHAYQVAAKITGVPVNQWDIDE